MTQLKLSEAQFQGQVIDYAQLTGWLCYHPWTSIHSAAGFPDLTLVRGPRLVMAELKSDAGKVTAAQWEWLRAFFDVPCVEVYVWRPRTWRLVEQVLARAPAAASTPTHGVKVGPGPALSAASPVLRGSRPPDGGDT